MCTISDFLVGEMVKLVAFGHWSFLSWGFGIVSNPFWTGHDGYLLLALCPPSLYFVEWLIDLNKFQLTFRGNRNLEII